MKINKILVLVELENGDAHQVLTSREQKEICVHLLRSEDGQLRLSQKIKPIKLELEND
jgi:hypothetical protein